MKKIVIQIMNDVDDWRNAEPLGGKDARHDCVVAIQHHLFRARATVQYLYDINYISYKDYTEFGKAFEEVYNYWRKTIFEPNF